MNDRVQIQIVTYNSRDVIVRCLVQADLQRFVNTQILVIDNASQDGTATLVRESFPRVRVIQNKTNVGYAAAHNQGIQLALKEGFDFVLTLNPDVRLDPDYLKHVLTAHTRHSPTVACLAGVTGKLMRDDMRTLDSTGLEMQRFLHVRDRGSGQIDRGQYDTAGPPWGICGAAALYTMPFIRAMVHAGGFFDETFFIYKEDVDVCWRAARLGWYFGYVPEATALHARGWKAGEPISEIALRHSLANQVALLIAYAPLISSLTWQSFFVEGVRWLLLSLRRPTVVKAASKLVWKNLRHNLEKRRSLLTWK